MPQIYELFGKPVVIHDDARRAAQCPFTTLICDGGGNRHQTKITLSRDPELARYFDNHLEKVIPGVCSIGYESEVWVVCPRRLFGFKTEESGLPLINHALQAHERDVLFAAGIPRGVDVGLWSEVYLRYEDNDSEINYHFDFIAAPLLRDITLESLCEPYSMSQDAKRTLFSAAKQGGVVAGRYQPTCTLHAAPDLSQLCILEVMTASTSGSNTTAGTNIAAAFKAALLGQDHQSPGINQRQVWGRMATQLFAKTALAEAWQGKTVWVVQDMLLDNIKRTTQLDPENVSKASTGNITFVTLAYRNDSDIPTLGVKAVYQGSAGIDFTGSDTYADILLPKSLPSKQTLLTAMLRRKPAAIVRL